MWRTQAQAVSRNFQRARHNSMQAEWSHKIGEHVVSVFARVILGNEAVGFDWRAGIARIANCHRHAMRRLCKRALRIAIAERAFARDVRAEAIVQEWLL